jgi:predicted O-methyltransferase YrrM
VETPSYITTDPLLEQYAEAHTSPESELLHRLNRETHLKLRMPNMLSGHLQGAFLRMISQLLKPICILEIGTFTGYSAICLAEGLQHGGILHTIDNNPEMEDFALRYFREAGMEQRISIHIGEAREIIPGIEGPLDLVFIDADKDNYINYYNLVIHKVPQGGFIIADNALWYGKVLDPDALTDKETAGIVAFNEYVQKDIRVENVLLPLRDGLMVIRKL